MKMKVTLGSTITVENPTPELVSWCKKELKISNPDYARKLKMNFWLGNTPPFLYLYEVRGNTLVLPFGILKDILPLLREKSEYYEGCPVPTMVNFGKDTVPLYDYQREAVNKMMDAKYGILQSKAGSGKTQMGIALVQEYGRKALWLTHTQDLLKQSKSRAEMYLDKNLMGTITEGKVNIGKGITFATIQTMCRLNLPEYKNIWDVVIVDECHRVAGTPTAMTQFSKVLNSLAARHKFGLSATVHRSDGMIKATYALFGRVEYVVPDEAVADKVMRVGIKPIATDVKMSPDCLNTDGTINYAKLITYLTEEKSRNCKIVNSIASNRGKPSLILSDRVKHLELLLALLPDDMRQEAVMINGKMVSKTDKELRVKALEDMRTGKKKYLFATYQLAKEGLDIPCLERLYMATPQKDYAIVAQSIGRIARVYDGKQDPICYDFVDDMGYLIKNYKARCTTYKKENCYFVEE